MKPRGADKPGSAFSTQSYSGYAGLPPLAGLETMQEACTRGLTVSESVNRLKRVHWALKRLHRTFVSRITGMHVYELKMAFSLHAHYCVEHVDELAERVKEMRQPPHGLDVSPHALSTCSSMKSCALPALKLSCLASMSKPCRRWFARLSA